MFQAVDRHGEEVGRFEAYAAARRALAVAPNGPGGEVFALGEDGEREARCVPVVREGREVEGEYEEEPLPV